MAASKVHHCISQEMVSQGIEEPPAAKCRCKKYIGLTVATQMVKNGEARWVVTKRTRGVEEERCRLCNGNLDVKNCALCADSRKVMTHAVIEDYGEDIVLVSRAAVDKAEKKYRPALAMKTPRVATIEEEHIELAYVYEVKEAQERIEEYGRLILDARMFVGKDRVPVITTEPDDDPETGQGREYDYGRAI